MSSSWLDSWFVSHCNTAMQVWYGWRLFLPDWAPDLCHTAILQCKCDVGGDFFFQTGLLICWHEDFGTHPIIWSFYCQWAEQFFLTWLLISWTLHYGQFLFWVILTITHCALEYSNLLSTVSCWLNSRAFFSRRAFVVSALAQGRMVWLHIQTCD